MKFGYILPFNNGAREVAEYAHIAEETGWDGFFIPEAVWHVDVWVALTAAAMRTERIRLGTMLSQLPRAKPWKLASESAALDNLSGGRVTLSLGMGALFMGYSAFPDEVTDKKVRAELLDEGIDLLTLLYAGIPFKFNGRHYHVDLTQISEQFYPPAPVQKPRIPLWVHGVWPRRKSMQRVLRCDGLLPTKVDDTGQFVEVRPGDIADMRAFVVANRAESGTFDIVVEGQTLGLDRSAQRDKLQPWQTAGATWWLESMYQVSHEQAIDRLRQGPPRL